MKLMRQKVLPDLAKSRQSAKTVLPDVAKCRQRGSKGFEKVPRGSKLFQGFQGVPKGKCYQMWQKVAKGVPKVVQGRPTLFAKAHGLERLLAALARRASAAGAP